MKITVAVEVYCKPEGVFPWIADPDKAMRWQKGVKGGEIIEEMPEKIGTTFREEMEENGKRLVMYGEITGYVRDKFMSFHLNSNIHRVEVSYSIEWKDNRSILTAESIIHWKFPMNIISLFIGCKIKEGILRRTESEFAELKKLCEANGS